MNTMHRTIMTGNGAVHYWITRNENRAAKCLVFTHGLTADHSMFEMQEAFFSKDYTIITWDVPLHGLSRPYLDFSYKNTALNLYQILEKEQIEQVILVGMSMGGYPNQVFAHLFPAKVESMIMLDTTPFGINYYSKSDLWWLSKVAKIAKLFPDFVLRESMARSVSLTKYSYHKMKEMLTPLSKTEILEQMDIAYGNFARENTDILINCPVLLLLGEKDRTGKVKQYNFAWAEKTGYPLHLIAKAAHFSNGDNSKQVNQEIERFLL